MNDKKLVIATAVLAVALLASTVYAGPGGWLGCCGGGRGAALWNELTEDQRKEITSLETDFYKKLEALRSQIATKSIELRELAGKESPDEAVIQKKTEEIWALKDAMRDERRALSTKIRSQLTAEQKKKLGPFGPGFGPLCGYGPGRGGGFCGACPFAAQGPGNVL
jgi:Spy/CpxP family protein refolding chaperone